MGTGLLGKEMAERESQTGSVRIFIEFNLANFGLVSLFNGLAMLIQLLWKDVVYMEDKGFINYFLLIWSLKLFKEKQQTSQ